MKKLMMVVSFSTLCALSLFAQPVPEHERVLIPLIVPQPIEGAYGSRWVTELHGFNGSSETINVDAPSLPCGYPECVTARPVPPGWVDLGYLPPSPRAAIIYLEGPQREAFTFNLRIRDLSRQALTWGTELPVVRERDALSGRFSLLNVPTADRFRWHLRMYGFDGQPEALVHVRISELETGSELVSVDVSLAGGANPAGVATIASWADLLSTDPRLAGALVAAERLRIEIEPVTQGRYWAFVSVTNNETQHVTVVTPQ